mmetsp:Transcript_96578/g.191424  ORF Transcript_96578/g.191424 Transcript_96578/m.191424 type:complete len:144 (+) Transcript_96578:477-908(+)
MEVAKRLERKGLELRPSWAQGAWILAEDVDADDFGDIPWTWNLAVSCEDEDSVFAALAALPYKIRPRFKPGIGRYQVPQLESLMMDASSDSEDVGPTFSASSSSMPAAAADQAYDWRCIEVNRTFLQIHPTPMASIRSLPRTA